MKSIRDATFEAEPHRNDWIANTVSGEGSTKVQLKWNSFQISKSNGNFNVQENDPEKYSW
jgi:hypothetical protein